MRKVESWLALLGSLASIISLLLGATTGTWLLIPLLGSFVAIVVLVRLLAPHRPRTLDRPALTSEGRRLILAASKSVVMFGRDLSWAYDYCNEIRDKAKNVTVTVICEEPTSEDSKHARDLLTQCGANVRAVSRDHGLRATLIDADNPHCARLFLAVKRRPVVDDPDQIEYQCRVFAGPDDMMLIRAVDGIRESITRRV